MRLLADDQMPMLMTSLHIVVTENKLTHNCNVLQIGDGAGSAGSDVADAPIPGYEKENSNLLHGHYSEQGMPLAWKPSTPAGKKPPSVAGELVRARVYLRDATVYAMGAGNAWD